LLKAETTLIQRMAATAAFIRRRILFQRSLEVCLDQDSCVVLD
jgi:hypothetical protein